jgi:hypothetical protein
MQVIYNHEVQMWAAEFLAALFLLGGLLVFAVGAGLIVWNQGMQRVFTSMNHWVSTRRVMRPLEIPHHTSGFVMRHRRWIAAFFVIGGCYSLVRLGLEYNERASITLLGMGALPFNYAGWLAESFRWLLLLGNAVAVIIGVQLAFFPQNFAALEKRAGLWISNRKVAKGADKMNMPLDTWVAAHSRLAGWVFAVIGAVMTIDFAILFARLV